MQKFTLWNLPIISVPLIFWLADLLIPKDAGLTMAAVLVNVAAFILLCVQAGIYLFFVGKFILKKIRK